MIEFLLIAFCSTMVVLGGFLVTGLITVHRYGEFRWAGYKLTKERR